MDSAARMPEIECGEAFADFRAAADPLRHQRKAIERTGGVALAQSRGYMGKARMEEKSFRLLERKRDRMHEPHEEAGIEFHRTRSIKQHDKAQGFGFAPAEGEIERLAAM